MAFPSIPPWLVHRWDSLGSVDKVSVSSTTRLVQTGEEIIGEERLAWQVCAPPKQLEQ